MRGRPGELARLAGRRSPLVLGHEEPVIVWRRVGRWVRTEDARGRRWESVSRLESRLARGAASADDGEMAGTILRSEEGVFVGGAAAGVKGRESTLGALARTRHLLHLERGDLAVVLIYGIGLGFLSLSVPVAVQSLVNTVAFGSLVQPLLTLSVLLLVALLGAAALRAMQLRVVEMLQRRLVVRVVADLSRRLARVHPDAFRARYGPELLNRFFDVFNVQKALALLLLGALDALLIAAFGMVLLAFYHPTLLAFDLLLILGCVVVFGALGYRGTETSIAESGAKYALASWLEQMSRQRFALKMGSGAELARSKAEGLTTDYLLRREAHFRIVFRQFVGALGLEVAASVALLVIGGHLVIARELSIGQLVAAELVVTAVVASLAKLGSKVETFYDLVAAVDKLGIVLDLPVEKERSDVVEAVGTEHPVRLRVMDLPIPGPGASPGVSLSVTVHAGERVALSGLPEAGCEALAETLFGMRGLGGGRVEVDGVDLRELGLSCLRSRVVVVREAETLPMSIADNVRVGRLDASTEEVLAALAAVDLRTEVQSLTAGASTEVAPLGSPLSRGQARRLTLARAVAARPSLLVIDRTLDHLDVEERRRTWRALCGVPDLAILVLTEDPYLRDHSTRALNLEDAGTSEEAA